MAGGLVVLAAGPGMDLSADGLGSGVHLVALSGILLLILGYGMYMPAAYAAVRQITTEKTAAMGFAMLYALMNLGGWLPTFFPPVRKAIGIAGTYWVFAGILALGVVATFFLLSRRTTERAVAAAKAERERGKKPDESASEAPPPPAPPGPKAKVSLRRWLKSHPLADLKFTFFIFALIPVQTLLAHTWLTLPQYTSRAYEGTWIGENFEAAYSFNSLLIFVLVPVITALTRKVRVYYMLVAGTLVMAAPTFLLTLGPNFSTFLLYLVLMTVGEAMWQPRFLQFAAEIAPEGRTGAYMGVAQLPWFLTKVLTGLYAGWFLQEYCPDKGELNTEFMWFVYGCIAAQSTVLLLLARRWLATGLKERAEPGR
jgi:MFS family permease